MIHVTSDVDVQEENGAPLYVSKRIQIHSHSYKEGLVVISSDHESEQTKTFTVKSSDLYAAIRNAEAVGVRGE